MPPSASNVQKGLLVGTGNVLVVAFAFALTEARRPNEVFAMFLAMSFAGIFFTLAPSALIGSLAGRVRRARLPIIAGAGFALVAVLGLLMSSLMRGGDEDLFLRLIPLACMPTAAAAAILERWTRPEAPITSATALSGSSSGSRESRPSRTTSCT